MCFMVTQCSMRKTQEFGHLLHVETTAEEEWQEVSNISSPVMCVCVCVLACVRVREREKEREIDSHCIAEKLVETKGSLSVTLYCLC